jgi:hypothetical protein
MRPAFHRSACIVLFTSFLFGGCTVASDDPSSPAIDAGPDGPSNDTSPDTIADTSPPVEDAPPAVDDAAPAIDSAPTTDAAALVVVVLGPTATAAQIRAAITDDHNDVVELTAGTYSPGLIKIDVDRTRPVVVRPAAGAAGKVIWKQASTGSGAFWIGQTGKAGNITIDGLVFDGFTLGDTGVLWVGYAHDLALTHITVRNTTGHAGYSWALYVSTDGSHGASNVVADDWVVEGGGVRSLSAMQSYHTPNAKGVRMHRWKVKNVAYAVYAESDATGLDFSDWTIADSGHTTGAGNIAVYFANVKGTFANMHLTTSGTLKNVGGTMTDLGASTC